jgi:hypothetical protein
MTPERRKDVAPPEDIGQAGSPYNRRRDRDPRSTTFRRARVNTLVALILLRHAIENWQRFQAPSMTPDQSWARWRAIVSDYRNRLPR